MEPCILTVCAVQNTCLHMSYVCTHGYKCSAQIYLQIICLFLGLCLRTCICVRVSAFVSESTCTSLSVSASVSASVPISMFVRI